MQARSPEVRACRMGCQNTVLAAFGFRRSVQAEAPYQAGYILLPNAPLTSPFRF
jgi:hypothetical protein